MPPGAATLLDANVSFVDADRQVKSIAFLGQRALPRDLFMKTKLVLAPMIDTAFKLRRFLQQNPVQLMYHRTRVYDSTSAPVESFRVAQLLSNKACVISLRSHNEDEELFNGVINFTNNVDRAFNEIKHDIRGCQMSSFHRYISRFAPVQLFSNSGFAAVWREIAPGKK